MCCTHSFMPGILQASNCMLTVHVAAAVHKCCGITHTVDAPPAGRHVAVSTTCEPSAALAAPPDAPEYYSNTGFCADLCCTLGCDKCCDTCCETCVLCFAFPSPAVGVCSCLSPSVWQACAVRPGVPLYRHAHQGEHQQHQQQQASKKVPHTLVISWCSCCL